MQPAIRAFLSGAAALLLQLAVPLTGNAETLQPWHHGLLEAKSDAGIFYMVGNGFAERQGLNLDFVEFKSDAIGLKALLAGDLDSYESALNGTMVAASRGVDIKLIGCHWPGQPLALFARDSIHSVEDLRGKTLAISTPFSNPDVIARLILAHFEVPADQVSFANLGGDLDRFRALAAGVADAALISTEYVPIAAQQGVHVLVTGRAIVPDYVRLCIFSTAKTIATRRDALVHFTAAEMTALDYAITHRDEALALTRKITGAKENDARLGYFYDDTVNTKSVDPDLDIPMAKLQWMEQLLIKGGNLPGPFELDKMIDPSIRASALKLVGK
jgi:NitT/TauT family transport system substrate-binding protein